MLDAMAGMLPGDPYAARLPMRPFVEEISAHPKKLRLAVINKSALDSILSYIETGKKEGRLIAGGHAAANADGGYFVEPTVIADVDPKATIAQEEIFGPVLAVMKAKDFDDALRIANDTQYGLTGAVFTNNPEKIRKAAHVAALIARGPASVVKSCSSLAMASLITVQLMNEVQ